jgi:hypothetical protein
MLIIEEGSNFLLIFFSNSTPIAIEELIQNLCYKKTAPNGAA